MVDTKDVALCIPTLNPGRWVDRLVEALSTQRLRPEKILIVDSSSTDDSIERFDAIGADIITIGRHEFDHGGTRNLVLRHFDARVYVFLTQDAVPVDRGSIERLVTGLCSYERAGVAYGRQVPPAGASPSTRAHREFNYPSTSSYRTAEDVTGLGVRAAFSSNSFAAYRAEALAETGGFPAPIIACEDRWTAARLLQRGWGVAYVADACVEHAHEYSLAQEFRRYFDNGVFESTNRWMLDYLGSPGREGMRLVRHQAAGRRRAGERLAIERTIGRAAVCWAGYRVGRAHRLVPVPLRAAMSMNPAYWRN